MSQLFSFIVGVVIGIIVGYTVRLAMDKLTRDRSELLTRKTTEEIVIVMMVMTYVSSIFMEFTGIYQIPNGFHTVMGIVVGLLSATKIASVVGGNK